MTRADLQVGLVAPVQSMACWRSVRLMVRNKDMKIGEALDCIRRPIYSTCLTLSGLLLGCGSGSGSGATLIGNWETNVGSVTITATFDGSPTSGTATTVQSSLVSGDKPTCHQDFVSTGTFQVTDM